MTIAILHSMGMPSCVCIGECSVSATAPLAVRELPGGKKYGDPALRCAPRDAESQS